MRASLLLAALALAPAAVFPAFAAAGAPGMALYDAPKYRPGFAHFDYVNPDAPKGGLVKLAETGTFDSLNPFILKGVKAPGLSETFESLMVASLDEPLSMYGLIAETVTLADDRRSASFELRREAKWHDGTPITADDVVFSFETLKTRGDPTYRILYAPITGVQKTGERRVTFTFADAANRELPFIAAQMPIFSQAYYRSHDFDKTTLEAPLGSGPYRVAEVQQGRSITYARVEDYWGRDLPVNRGMYNYDRIRYDMYRDENVTLEALKAGEYDFRREYIARNWATAYDAPAVRDGRIIKREIPDHTPQGMQAFIFNTRKDRLSDARVREAIDLTMDYEWINKTIFYGAYVRNSSFFENTEFQSRGVPEGRELALLAPFRDELPPALFTEPFRNATTDGSGNARENLLKAQKLLEEAGWTVQGGKRVNARGEALTLEFLLRQPTMERVIGPMRKNLERLGITATIRNVDDAQYQKRTDAGDFDIVTVWINRGVFYPGNEQVALWHSSQAEVKGGNNLGGVNSKAVDAMLAALTGARSKDELLAAGRALDRILLWQHYVIPNWHSGSFRVAYWDRFGLPDTLPRYHLGFHTWWVKDAGKK